jgi:hypothetical protein
MDTLAYKHPVVELGGIAGMGHPRGMNQLGGSYKFNIVYNTSSGPCGTISGSCCAFSITCTLVSQDGPTLFKEKQNETSIT